jgi:hypothetical protein
VSFMASVGLRDVVRQSADSLEPVRELFQILVNTASVLADGSPLWIDWIAAAPEDWRNDNSSIILFDQLSRLTIDGPLFRVDEEEVSWMASLPVSDDSWWVKYVVLAHTTPDLLGSISHEDLVRAGHQRGSSSQAMLVSDICTLAASDRAAIEKGELDDVILSVVGRNKTRSYLRILFNALMEQTTKDTRN